LHPQLRILVCIRQWESGLLPPLKFLFASSVRIWFASSVRILFATSMRIDFELSILIGSCDRHCTQWLIYIKMRKMNLIHSYCWRFHLLFALSLSLCCVTLSPDLHPKLVRAPIYHSCQISFCRGTKLLFS
jgi:hypothetical protein